MRYTCDTCQSNLPVTLDHTGPHMICYCVGCAGEVKFGRILSVTNFRYSISMVKDLRLSLDRIKYIKEFTGHNNRPVNKDVAYHNLFIIAKMEHSCHKCDQSGPVKFGYAGPHIKAVCGNCGFYIKFVHQGVIPNFLESKNKIWALTTDLKAIAEAKVKVGVHDDLTGKNKDLAYHNLFNHIYRQKNGDNV